MFGNLPETVKQEVLYHLQHDNFPAAKRLYDSWLNNHCYPEKEANQ
jgi:hypothetical protein